MIPYEGAVILENPALITERYSSTCGLNDMTIQAYQATEP